MPLGVVLAAAAAAATAVATANELLEIGEVCVCAV